MQSRIVAGLAITLTLVALAVPCTADQKKDQLTYVEKTQYPVIEEMEAHNEALREAAEAKSAEILARVKEAADARDDAKRELRFDISNIVRPTGPGAFETQAWHFPPTPQYLTGSCWSFSSTSFIESEIHRISGQEIKLSEMWTAYWEFVNKARGYVATRGESYFDIKDSNRSSRLGDHKGYYFYRGDYVKLKMLTMTVHRDRVSEILKQIDNE